MKIFSKAIITLLISAILLGLTGRTLETNAKASTVKKVTVSSKSALYKAMKKSGEATIVLEIKGKKTIKIKNTGNPSNKDLVIQGSKLTVVNSAVWNSITIGSAAKYTEKASGNDITVSDAKTKITIAKKVKVARLTAPGKELDIALGKKAKILDLVYQDAENTDPDTEKEDQDPE